MLVKLRSASAPVHRGVVCFTLADILALRSNQPALVPPRDLLSHHIVAMNRLSKCGWSTSSEQLLLVASCDTMR